MNKLMTALSVNVYNQLAALREEEGAEAIEWIAMVAVILILLLAAEPIFNTGGTTIANQIITAITQWIAKFV
ncbi:MAG: hypothetical protein DYG89_05975 [Caldilinea sp. CFX5]|nr:hypothetical protein [Caldilinea sp. CFX5]